MQTKRTREVRCLRLVSRPSCNKVLIDLIDQHAEHSPAGSLYVNYDAVRKFDLLKSEQNIAIPAIIHPVSLGVRLVDPPHKKMDFSQVRTLRALRLCINILGEIVLIRTDPKQGLVVCPCKEEDHNQGSA
jgi:hypothetical protein